MTARAPGLKFVLGDSEYVEQDDFEGVPLTPPTPPATSPPHSPYSPTSLDSSTSAASVKTRPSTSASSPEGEDHEDGATPAKPNANGTTSPGGDPDPDSSESDTSTWVSRNRKNRRRAMSSGGGGGEPGSPRAYQAQKPSSPREQKYPADAVVQIDSEGENGVRDRQTLVPPSPKRRISLERNLSSPPVHSPRSPPERPARHSQQDRSPPGLLTVDVGTGAAPYYRRGSQEKAQNQEGLVNGTEPPRAPSPHYRKRSRDISPDAGSGFGYANEAFSDVPSPPPVHSREPLLKVLTDADGRIRKFSREISSSSTVETIPENPEAEDPNHRPPPRLHIKRASREGAASLTREGSDPSFMPDLNMSDEEFQENYLGNIPAHKRRFGVIPSPQIRNSPNSLSPTSPPPVTPRKLSRNSSMDSSGASASVKRISFDFTNQGFTPDHFLDGDDVDVYHSRKFNNNNTLQKTRSAPELPNRYKSARRLSAETLDSISGSDISLSKTVAAHVRRDSIALFSDKVTRGPLNKASHRLAVELEQLRQAHTHMTKKEILTKYRLHIFVALIFVITLLFVSLGWYYRDKTREEDLNNQKIFVDPRKRLMTLSDNQDVVNVLVGQDLPQWQLPLHCPVHMDGNPNSKECVWKKNAILRVDYFEVEIPDTPRKAHCYNVTWTTLRLPRVPHDCFDVGSAVWYGPSNQSAETWPVSGSFSYVPSPNHLSNSGIYSSVVEHYWLSSSGVGLLLNSENPLTLQWNSTRPNYLCVISNYTGPMYGQNHAGLLPHMNYTICNGPNPKETHSVMKNYMHGTKDVASIPRDVFSAPHWSAKGLSLKENYDENDVQEIVNKLKTKKLNCSVFMLDGEWQANRGDLDFDMDRFANLSDLTEQVQDACGSVGIEVSPYFDYRSVENFHLGVDRQFFVKDAGGEVPGLTRWKSREAVAMLDVSRPSARAWFNSIKTGVVNKCTARVVRMAYGEDGWLPYKPTFSDPTLSLYNVRRMVAEMAGQGIDRLILEHTSGSQRLSSLIAVPTEIQLRDGRSCLSNTIETALTLGLLGYPYVMADGLGKGGQASLLPPQDLFTRWMQMAAFFPAYKFSVPLWNYNENTLNLARNLSKIHSEVVVPKIFEKDLMAEVASGLPIMRPVWWLDPGNKTLHSLRVRDQFLIGDTLLVAPVLCEGVTQRSIYIPHGVWADRLRGALVLGPRVIEGYRVEQNEIPHFLQMKTYEDLKQDL